MAYKKQVTQVGTPRQIGSGGRGAAGMLASAQANLSLAQKLSSFSDQLQGMAGSMAQAQGAKDATIDIYKRKQKVNKINANPNTSEEQKATEIATITEGTERFFSGIYSKSYESAATSAYSNQVATDAKTAYDLAMVDSQGDPEAFIKAYSEFSKETTRGAPTEATAILAQQTTTKYGSSGYKSLMLAKMGANTARQKTAMKDNMTAINKQFSDAYYSGDAIEIARLGSVATATQDAAVRDGLISPAQRDMALSSMADRAVIDSVNRKFGEEVNVGRGDIVYMQFRQAERNGDFETQDPEEIAKIKSSMLKQIKEFNDASLERGKYEKESYELMSDSTFREGTQMAANNTLTESQITKWEGSGVLSTQDADNLRDRIAVGNTRKVSDALTLSRYAESVVLIDTDNYMIQQDSTLSEPDKTKLIQRKEQLLEGRFNWTKTNDGREAKRRIKAQFGILEGTLMAKLDLNNQTMRDYDDLYKEFYAEVSQSPSPDLDALPIADRLLKEYNQKQVDKRKAQEQQREARRIEDAKNSAASANDSILVKIGWSDPVTYEDMMLEQ